MPDPFKKLPPGSLVTAFSITAYNAMIDMLNWWKTQTGGASGPGGLADWNQGVFRVKNTTGYDLFSYDPVGIDGPIFNPSDDTDSLTEFYNQSSMKGVEPTEADHAGGKWGVMLEAAAQNKIGRCCTSGMVPVRVLVNSYLDGFCDAIDAETVGAETVRLGSGAGGAKILWWEAASGSDDGTVVWAVVRLGSSLGVSLAGEHLTQNDPQEIAVNGHVASWSADGTGAKPQYSNDVTTSQDGFTIVSPGVYLFGFSMSVKGEGAAAAGTSLTLALDCSGNDWLYTVRRLQSIGDPPYGLAWEVMASTGILDLVADDTLEVKNVSAVKLEVQRANFWIARIGDGK